MSMLSRVGAIFVERVPEEKHTDNSFFEEEEGVSADVELEGVQADTFVSDIYEKNDMHDMSHSVFKAEELVNSLPNTMATDVKRQSVLAILTSFGITADEIVDDGVQRLTLLNAAHKAISKEGADFVSDAESQIEAYKIQITALEKQIAEKRDYVKISGETLQAEATRIDGLVKFIGG